MRRRFFSFLVVFFLLCFGGSILYILGPSPCLGVEASGEVAVFSLDVKDKPLGKVLKEIEKSTGYKITVDDRWVNFPVWATLKNVGVEEGLRRLLRGFNYALIVADKEKTIFIDIRVPDEQREVKPVEMEVLPPRIPGEKGTTVGEIQASQLQRKETKPQDMEVLPPMGPDQSGMTVRQLKALEAKQKPKDIVVPPPVLQPKGDVKSGME